MAQSESSPIAELEEQTTANTYRLSCNTCSFETTVEGDCYDALDLADAHREEYAESVGNHFVDFTLADR